MSTEPIVSLLSLIEPAPCEHPCSTEGAHDHVHDHVHAQAEGCTADRLMACDRHDQYAGAEAAATPCGHVCPSVLARQQALRESIANANAAAEAELKRRDKTWRLHRKWDRAARVFGESTMERLAQTSVTIFGLGGVGSFTAEGLIRSGIGRLVLVDFDDVCVTNVNRQLHAMKGAYSKPKCDEMATRMRLINPEAEIIAIKAFYNKDTSDALLEDQPDFVVDAIDNMTAKLHLIATCRQRNIPIVSSMGAAGKLDPTRIQVADIARTHGDPMAREVRRYLRKHYGLGEDGKDTGVMAVYSPEARTYPKELSYDALTNGFMCVCPSKENELHSCDTRNLIDGSAAFVTSVFGMVAASVVVRTIMGEPIQTTR